MTRLQQAKRGELLILISLFMMEASLAIIVVGLHMKGERSVSVFLSSKHGLVSFCALIAVLISGGIIRSHYLDQRRSPSGHFRLFVMMNLVTVLLILVTGEILVRVGTRHDLNGETFYNVRLKPKSWDQLRERALKVFEDFDADQSVLVYDDRLGWTVGVNRYRPPQGTEPPYASSADGLRAPRPGVRYDSIPGKADIAIIGDSYTFGSRVAFEETWGYKLDRLLGDDYRVLNFGVSGYSIGQAYRRYMKDVAPRAPNVVIFCFIDNDLIRTMRVYPFIFESWRLPFSKPRFVLEDGELKEVNHNTVPFTQILAADDVSNLPFVQYDIGYRLSHWHEDWLHASYLIRLITSRFPAWSDERPQFSEGAILSTNLEIIKRFIRFAEADSIPLIVWLPEEGSVEGKELRQLIGKRMLEQTGIPYIDPTACLLEVAPADRFVGGHYSPQGNNAVANCIYRAVKGVLG